MKVLLDTHVLLWMIGDPGRLSRTAELRAGELPVSARHALLGGGMAWDHQDPFDRLLAAQAVLESVPLVTKDPAFTGVPGVRVLW